MPDETDSYCERCGTRYVFRASAAKTLSLSGARVLAKGLKNFVLTDGQSISDAMTLARHDDEHEDATRAAEAFHRAFNFCMTCRQYACSSCWNERQGACLTCAPEPGFEPVAPEDHLIVRTPVARGDNDWALFPDILGVDGGAHVNPSPPLAAWPSQDLQIHPPAVIADGNGKYGHDEPTGEPGEQPAWSLWPTPDQIAPEMTLTPEELALVQARLAAEEAVKDAPAVAGPIERQTLPEVPEVEPWVLGSTLTGDPTRLGEPSVASADDQSEPAAGGETAATDEQGAPLEDAGMAPPHPAEAREQGPAIARLLGRLGQHGDGDSPARGLQGASRLGQPAGDPWPRPTPWSERQIEPHEWLSDGTPGVAEPEAAPIDSTFAAAPPAAPTPADGPVPATAGQEMPFEIRPATDDIAASPDLAALDRPEVGSEADEAQRTLAPSQATPNPALPVAPAPSSQERQEPAPWPPLGASWPARETRGAPWPGPDAPPVPAAVVAKEALTPVVAEMWAQSSQEVLNRGSVRVCHRCALPVSTQARFCRRCGTKQA
jgi:ribosomal protein L40E